MQRYEVWADQMTAGLHHERVPWMNDTLMGLRITTRLTHPNWPTRCRRLRTPATRQPVEDV
ncbi:hypothetical protein [Micromonospora sp. CPCC 205558]|uniref:hypothetical protein n=1 Tax=Micromonospora sp. CPCC 205558 TaxID=3122403 RepID=UPI002FF350CE